MQLIKMSTMEQAETDDKANIIEHVNIPDTSYICTLWEVYVHTYIHIHMYVAIKCCRHLMHFNVGQSLWPFTGGGVPHAKTRPMG